MNFPPHVHCLVSGGGISEDGATWHPARRRFLLPIKALARKVRGKVRALWQRRCPGVAVPEEVWRKDWIAHVTAWGKGEQAVLDYLARYVFRIAITNARIVGLDEAGVTISYRDRRSGRQRTCQLSGEEFMRRFLQHVLPRGCDRCCRCRPRRHPGRCRKRRCRRSPPRRRRPPRRRSNPGSARTVTTGG